MKKVIIAGSRGIHDINIIQKAIDQANVEVSEVVSGMAGGVDQLGVDWAKENNIPVKPFAANWKDLSAPGAVIKLNKFRQPYNARAGYDRNKDMAEYVAPDGMLIAIMGRKKSRYKEHD